MAKSLQDKVVLVTGVSSGLGKDLANSLLEKGAKVVGTFRKQAQADAFIKSNPQRALGVVMDITDAEMVKAGVQKVVAHFGRIDILANNVGVGALGAVEETSEEEARNIFDINFFGGLSVIQNVLPIMRQQSAGHLVLFSALGGFHGVPGFALYASAKAATIVLGESLSAELASFGIDVTILTIGVFDTGMSTRVLFAEREIEAYKNSPAGQFKNLIKNIPGKEPNDPTKASKAIINLLESDHPPLHTALGSDALAGMRKKLVNIELELSKWEENAASTVKD
ncbi:MAG: SDR family NAD(P)-dependent oxidoreductase [Bacteroidota bacterium]